MTSGLIVHEVTSGAASADAMPDCEILRAWEREIELPKPLIGELHLGILCESPDRIHGPQIIRHIGCAPRKIP